MTSSIVLSTNDELNNINTANYVELHWIKAHANYTGNEKADELAKKGTELTQISTDTPTISNQCLREELREHVVEFWNKDWQTNQPCRQTKHFFPDVNHQRWITDARKQQ